MCTEYEPLYQLPQTNIPIIVIKSVYFCIRYKYCTIYVNARICWNTSLRGKGAVRLEFCRSCNGGELTGSGIG